MVKMAFLATVAADRGMVFMPYHGMLAILGFFLELRSIPRYGLYAIPRSVTLFARLVVFEGFLVFEHLGDDRGWVWDIVQ